MGGSCAKEGEKEKIDTRRWWEGVKERKRILGRCDIRVEVSGIGIK